MKIKTKEILFEIGKNIIEVDENASLWLFGSAARNQETESSDIDLLVVGGKNRKKVNKIINEASQKYKREFQVVFTDYKFKGLDRQFLETVFREGILIFGKNPIVNISKMGLEPFVIIHYNLTKISNDNKMRLRRLLFGYKTRKKIRGKIYTAQSEGLLREYDCQKIGLATIKVPYKHFIIFKKAFQDLKIPFEVYDIWMSKT